MTSGMTNDLVKEVTPCWLNFSGKQCLGIGSDMLFCTLESVSLFFGEGDKNTRDAALKATLAYTLQISEDKIIIKKENNGKPYLEKNPLFFSVSHTGIYFIVAICKGAPIGVDIEEIRDIKDIDSVKSIVLSAEEQKSCESLKDFYRFWTLKEAYLKALGVGIQDNMQSVTQYSNCMAIELPRTNIQCSICTL